MEIITQNLSDIDDRHETPAKVEILKAIEDRVATFMDAHLKKRRLWHSSDFLPADEHSVEEDETFYRRLRERAKGIADHIRVSVVLNLLTEEGLPHFHRLISSHVGDESIWGKWNFMWTAEEDRHGVILHDYCRDARLFSWKHVEEMQYAYNERGFTPDWDKDPYRVFVYTTLQERATQIAHSGTGKMIGDDEPVIKGIFTSVAADEAKHFTFYRNVFKSILEFDPNRALESALKIMPAIDMPGISMPHYREMADVVRKAGIYTPWDYKKIVEESIAYWNIEALEGLNEAGRKAQDKIMAIPKRLQKVAEYIESRDTSKTYSFDFIYGRILTA